MNDPEIILHYRRSFELQQQRRQDAMYVYSWFLDTVDNGVYFRKWFYNRLKKGADTVFINEQKERKFVQRFYSGMWEIDRLRKHFNEDEIEIIKRFAEKYGAFDYW